MKPSEEQIETQVRPQEGRISQQAQSAPRPVVPEAVKSPSRGRRRAFFIFFTILILAAAAGTLYWLHSRQFESTDDAQIEAHLNPISARIDGTITHVYVDNNQFVKAGDPLVDLDPRDYEVALSQARAQLNQAAIMVTAQEPNVPITQVENTTNISTSEASTANAEAGVSAAEHDRDAAAARLAEAEANSAKAQADLDRYKILIAKEEVSQQEFDQIAATAKAQSAAVASERAEVESAARVVDQRQAQLAEARHRLDQYRQVAPQQVAIRRATVRSQQANAQVAKTQVEEAELKLAYTKIVAPVAGIVMRRSAEVGARVAAGQQLLMIAQVSDVWVTANFKETQLFNVKSGQGASVHVDALRKDFEAYVEDIGAGTGSVSSVLPPENATGNFVKVVQRIPVRLRLKPNQPDLDRLRPGMSVEADVRIGS